MNDASQETRELVEEVLATELDGVRDQEVELMKATISPMLAF